MRATGRQRLTMDGGEVGGRRGRVRPVRVFRCPARRGRGAHPLSRRRGGRRPPCRRRRRSPGGRVDQGDRFPVHRDVGMVAGDASRQGAQRVRLPMHEHRRPWPGA